MFKLELSNEEKEVLKKSLRIMREFLLKKDNPHRSWIVNCLLGKINSQSSQNSRPSILGPMFEGSGEGERSEPSERFQNLGQSQNQSQKEVKI